MILSFLKRSAPFVLKPDAAESLRLGLWGEQDKNTVGAKSVMSVMGCDTVAEGRTNEFSLAVEKETLKITRIR